MAKLISETVKLISETVKLISADPKTHIFGNFCQFLYYFYHKLTQNVPKSHYIAGFLFSRFFGGWGRHFPPVHWVFLPNPWVFLGFPWVFWGFSWGFFRNTLSFTDSAIELTIRAGFFFSAGKITQAQNNSSSKITQGFFTKKLKVLEEFALYVIAKNQTTVRKLQKISKLALKRFKNCIKLLTLLQNLHIFMKTLIFF